MSLITAEIPLTRPDSPDALWVSAAKIERLAFSMGTPLVLKTAEGQAQDEIHFNSRSGDTAWLSTFQWAPFCAGDGEAYRTVEHFYQAWKSRDSEARARVRRTHSGATARKAGRKVPLRKDWESVKDEVMLLALRLRFAWNRSDLCALVATGGARLVRAAPWDSYWGSPGRNRLGGLLETVRETARRILSPVKEDDFSPGYKLERDRWFLFIVSAAEALELDPETEGVKGGIVRDLASQSGVKMSYEELKKAVLDGSYLESAEAVKMTEETVFMLQLIFPNWAPVGLSELEDRALEKLGKLVEVRGIRQG